MARRLTRSEKAAGYNPRLDEEREMDKRNPRFGDFYVFHDDPREVVQIDAFMDGEVRYHSRVTGQNIVRKVEDFNEFYTRLPI